MKHHDLQKKLQGIWNRRHMALLVLMAVFLTAGATTSHASALYILTGTDDTAIVLDQNAQVQDFSSQLVHLSTGRSGYDVTLASGQAVTVSYHGAQSSVQSKKETISALLERLHMEPGPLDMVLVDLSDGALDLCKKNIRRHKLTGRGHLLRKCHRRRPVSDSPQSQSPAAPGHGKGDPDRFRRRQNVYL